MRVLWIGWSDPYTPQRIQDAARLREVQLTMLQVSQVSFVSSGTTSGVYHDGYNLLEEYDALIARTYYPFISESLTIARLFHDAGKPVVDKSLTDEGYVISKMHDYLLLSQQGLPVPRTWQVFSVEEVLRVAREVGFPCVLKGIHGSHGSHVYLIEDAVQLVERFTAYQPGELVLQEYLPAEEDYRLLVIGYHALGHMVSRRPAPGEFRTNVAFSGGSNTSMVSDHPGLALLAEHAARALRREFAGVDVRYHGTHPVVLEVNRQPIFENFEQTTGMDVAGAYLDYAIEQFRLALAKPASVSD